MSDTVIKVQGLGKQYRIGRDSGARFKYKSFRDTLSSVLLGPIRRLIHPDPTIPVVGDSAFWALKDINFEVKRGEVVGIIGRNGAGKSTLLKLLSRITDPTEGQIELEGRVGSLLEVGTGFHPELTGRENIFLNGAILGMKRTEIQKKFDEIVAFAETEKFLDTPVKYYSSGMYTRLAFAVAAHLEPEILVVDEVLAVGDTEFQKKCLGKMGEVAKEGRTVLFVSHNMPAVRSLCQTGVFLSRGRVQLRGSAHECVSAYLSSSQESLNSSRAQFEKPQGAQIWLKSLAVFCDGVESSSMLMGQSLSIEGEFESTKPVTTAHMSILINGIGGEHIVHVSTRYLSVESSQTPLCRGRMRCDFGALPLVEGSYSITFWIGQGTADDHHLTNVMDFEVFGRDVWGHGWVPPKEASLLWWPAKFTLTA